MVLVSPHFLHVGSLARLAFRFSLDFKTAWLGIVSPILILGSILFYEMFPEFTMFSMYVAVQSSHI
jgi:hypothetical protein